MYVINKLWFLSVCVMGVRCLLGRTTLVMHVTFIPTVSPVVMHHAIAHFIPIVSPVVMHHAIAQGCPMHEFHSDE